MHRDKRQWTRRHFLNQGGWGTMLMVTLPSVLRFGQGRACGSEAGGLQAQRQAGSGQYEITEAGKPVLRYNYQTIEPGEILKSIAPGNLIYARARSNYLHPLYGLGGEVLTQDWSVDHPHHRGIYWAWPEVDWRGQRGDLHALQRVFARPTGVCAARSGPDQAQIEA